MPMAASAKSRCCSRHSCERIVRDVSSRAAAVVTAVCALSCAFAGCGGGSDTDTTPAVGKPFALRAAAVCQKALKSKQAWDAFPVNNFDPTHPDKASLPKVAPWLEQQVA